MAGSSDDVKGVSFFLYRCSGRLFWWVSDKKIPLAEISASGRWYGVYRILLLQFEADR